MSKLEKFFKKMEQLCSLYLISLFTIHSWQSYFDSLEMTPFVIANIGTLFFLLIIVLNFKE